MLWASLQCRWLRCACSCGSSWVPGQSQWVRATNVATGGQGQRTTWCPALFSPRGTSLIPGQYEDNAGAIYTLPAVTEPGNGLSLPSLHSDGGLAAMCRLSPQNRTTCLGGWGDTGAGSAGVRCLHILGALSRVELSPAGLRQDGGRVQARQKEGPGLSTQHLQSQGQRSWPWALRGC